jgi:Fur family ferric uptake transcriptional regulator
VNADIFRQNGRPRTVQRDLIMQILTECSGHVAQTDIYERVHRQLPMVNRSTIARTLEALEEMRMIRHVHDADGSVRYHRAEDPLHVHFVCSGCGHVSDVAGTALLAEVATTLQATLGFVADFTHFPIAGLCAGCAGHAHSEDSA